MAEDDDRFRRQFRASHIPTVIWRRNGDDFVFDEVNEAAAAVAGALAETLIGMAATAIYRDRPDVLELMNRAWRLGQPLTLEAPVRVLIGGREAIFRVDVAPLGPEHLMLHAIDITAQFIAEEGLRAKESRHQILFEEASDGIVRLDDLGRVVEANRAAAAMLGYDSAALIGVRFFETAQEDEPAPTPGDDRSFVSERTFRRADGRVVQVELSGRSLIEGGQVLFLRDLTARRVRDAALREREQLLSTVLDGLPIGVIVADATGKIVRSNPAGDAIWGFHRTYTANAAPGVYHAWWVDTGEPIGPDDWASARALKSGEVSINELIEIETASGEHKIILNSAAPLLGESGDIRGVVVLNQDVTELQRQGRELERAQRLSAIGQLAATVAHEFNNVMMGMSPFIEVIQRRSLNDPQMTSLCDHIQQSLNRGKQITREILKFAQAPEPELRSTLVRALLESSMPELTAIAGRRVTIHVQPVDSDLAANIDPVQVHQALSNLVSNARDAMAGDGTITIVAESAKTSTPGPRSGEEWVEIAVSDRGGGIAPQHLERIFEPLFTTKQAGGTGLGLAVVQQVVQRHGGFVNVESTPGAGTTFRMCFRRCAPPDSADAVTETSARAAVRVIVLVEDDESVAAGLTAVLETEGIVTHVVTRGADAEPAVERYRPDVVVIDRGLPDMDGLEASRRLLERWPGLPLLFSTGHGGRADLDAMTRHARVAYLLKPYSVAELLEAVERLLRSG